jgi:hypothetical protein
MSDLVNNVNSEEGFPLIDTYPEIKEEKPFAMFGEELEESRPSWEKKETKVDLIVPTEPGIYLDMTPFFHKA